MSANEFHEGLAGEQNLLEFSKQSVRIGFIRKVYLLFTTQLVVTLAAMIGSTLCPSFIAFVDEYWWSLMIIAYVALCIGLMLAFLPEVGRSVPCNYISLFIFNVSISFVLAGILCHGDTALIVSSFGITFGMSIGITIYAITCKTDFTMCGGTLFSFCGIVGAFGILAIMYPSNILNLVVSAPFCLIYSLYLIYDTQLIISSRERAYQIDDYISASVILYWDFLRLLLEVMRILSQ